MSKANKFDEAEIYDVRYESLKGEVSQRTIIPIIVPPTNIKALDVSERTAQEQVLLRNLWAAYADYRDQFSEQMFDFETWLDHTGQRPDFELKYRTFVPENLQTIE